MTRSSSMSKPPGSKPPGLWPASVEGDGSPNRRQQVFAEWLVDILVYVVVLNLFVEYSSAMVIDSFTISVLTAVMLKVLLVVITGAKKKVWGWSRARGSRGATVAGVLGVWAILFLSKFLILEVEDLIFGDLVDLGGFVDVMVLAATLIVAREVVQRIYIRLGRVPNPAQPG